MSKKILLVDDELKIQRIVEIRLKASGYSVVTASDGAEGVAKAQSENPDLIIMDIMLPKMDGYKACGLLKNDARYAKIPIILFSAKALEEDRQMGEDVKADAYLTKPYVPEILLNKIKELIGEK